MELDNTFYRTFRDACYFGDSSKTHEAIATGRLSIEELDERLKLATLMSHADIVIALFNAGARVLTWIVDSLCGKDLHQDPRIVRYFLDHGLDPNSRLSSGEPLLPMILNPSGAAVHLETREAILSLLQSYSR
ncbi:hypothetical protein BJX99DRAFT_233939 [Aspergillus californicus]